VAVSPYASAAPRARWRLYRKRIQRPWREEGLRAPQRRKRQRLGDSTVPAERPRPERPDHLWAIDFQFDQTPDGRLLKLFNVVDEFTREATSATGGSTQMTP
jgi:putative transposase